VSLSCLVISRNPDLLNALLGSLVTARTEWEVDDEVLCSWNGSLADLNAVVSPQKPPFKIAQHVSYHFASNINQLAQQAKGEHLALLNDDLVLDPYCLDHALAILNNHKSVGIVGAQLRNPSGAFNHAGILINQNGIPYNRLRPERLSQFISPQHPAINRSGPIAAITGALMVMRKSDFTNVRMRETFNTCCEDVALCLDFIDKLNLHPFYAAEVSAVHHEKATRGEQCEQLDIENLKGIVSSLSDNGKSVLATLISRWSCEESDCIEAIVHELESKLQEKI